MALLNPMLKGDQIMKRIILLAAVVFALGMPFSASVPSFSTAGPSQDAPAVPKEIPDVIILAQDGKLGKVKFNHANHATKNYNIAGTGPIDCVECHHTAQPASEAAKHPPLKTAWPADRTTTLTKELLANDPNSVGHIACRNCHARAGTTPITLPAIPEIKASDSAAIVTLTNQLAFHRNCANCHADVLKNRKDIKGPTPQQCTKCHMK